MKPASRSLYKTRNAFGEICDLEIVCSDLGTMRGTACGATGDALEEFKRALSTWECFKGPRLYPNSPGFLPQNHKLIHALPQRRTSALVSRQEAQ